MGVNVDRTIAFTFATSAGRGRGNALCPERGDDALRLGFPNPLIAFTAAVMGGIGKAPREPVVGGLLIGVIQGLNDGAPYGLTQRWSQTVVFTIPIPILVFKPQGNLANLQLRRCSRVALRPLSPPAGGAGPLMTPRAAAQTSGVPRLRRGRRSFRVLPIHLPGSRRRARRPSSAAGCRPRRSTRP